MLFAVACTDDDITGGGVVPAPDDHGIGQLVLFSSGSVGNDSRATVVPYMEQDGRFVCKMFYHAKATDTDASPFDTITTPITSWLRVDDNEGNSVYWSKDYDMEGVDKNHQDFIDYGFDSRAQYFYWRNRLDHIFLGYTDYNKLKANAYGTTQGQLFMYPEYDDVKKTKVGENKIGSASSYKKLAFVLSPMPNPEYNVELAEQLGDEYPVPATIDVLQFKGPASISNHPGELGVHFPLSGTYYNSIDNFESVRTNTKNKIFEFIQDSGLSDEEKAALVADINREVRYSDEETTADGVFRNDRWWITFNPKETDAIVDNTINLEKAVVYQVREKVITEDIIATSPANTFDLTRGTKESMSEQPDPLIALTKMKPTGATQEANRVRLYFKHQFSQIQVNLTNAENTAEITPENIVSVELLGVSEKGYVFTNINPDGTQIPPSYDPIVISKYTEEQLKENPYGTSFNMFNMGDAKPQTSLKSFNAIAFGQLQAIRITWKEEDYKDPVSGETETGIYHVATYKITVDDRGNSLVNLRSGFRYVYDFELRRGTIAFIRAVIDPWILDEELNYPAIGTINE